MIASPAFVVFVAAVSIDAMITGQTFTRVESQVVDALRVALAVMSIVTTRFDALVDVLTADSIALETLVALARGPCSQVDAGRIVVAVVTLSAIVHSGTEPATFAGNAELLFYRTRQLGALLFRIHLLAMHAAVGARAIDAFAWTDLFSVVVQDSFQKALFETRWAAFSGIMYRVFAECLRTLYGPTLDLSFLARADVAALFPSGSILMVGTVSATAFLALALFHLRYPNFGID